MAPREIHSGERSFAVASPRPTQPVPPQDDLLDAHARAQAALLGKKTITIYVRKGDHAKERIISINPVPDGVHPIKLLNAGFALDGNSATLSADQYTFVSNAYENHGDIPDI